MQAQTLDIKSLKGFVRRRKKAFLVPFLVILMGSAITAFVLPAIYRSETKILIEGQQIPQEFVKTTITSYIEERLQTLRQQIMSRTKLLEIINQFNLYPDMRDRYSSEEILAKMRNDIDFKTISANIIDSRTGRPSAATIAFTLSYQGTNPATVQRVANVLASLFLEEDLKQRERLATVTTDFLEQESEDLKKQIQVLEEKISQFKKAHIGMLPEYNTMNLQAVARLESELERVDIRIRSLQEQSIYLKGEIAVMEPLRPVMTDEGKMSANPVERLKGLRLRLLSLQSSLSEKHPDIIKLKKEIQELEAQVGKTDDSVLKIKALNDMQGRLAEMKGRLGPKHPDVIKVEKEVSILSREVDQLSTEKKTLLISDQRPDNPAYINLMTRMNALESQMKGSLTEREQIRQSINEYRAKIERAPAIEKEYFELTRDYEGAKRKHNDIMNKLLEARISRGMQETQVGEKFSIIDAAGLPQKPFKPNRIAIVILGLVLGLGSGVGLAAFQEATDQSIKTVDEINALTGLPVFSVLNFIQTDREKRVKRIKRLVLAASSVCLIILALVLVDQFFMPLDILWMKIQNRMGLMGIPV